MKKLIFLLLITVASYGQTYQNPTFGTITTKTAPTTTTDPYVGTVNANGVIGKVAPENIPMNVIPPTTHYTPTTPTLKGHFQGLDNAIGNIPLTTAGNITRIWFTGDATTITAGTFYLTNAQNKGTVANVSQSVTNDDNQKKYFAQDLIGNAFATTTIFPPGVYAGNLSASTTPNSAQQRFTVELYRCDTNGTPIASGIAGAPVGDLGVTVILILDSGLLTLADGSVTNVQVSESLASQLTVNVGERIRYHVSAEKVGTVASNITESVWYGSSFNSFLDVPTPITSSGVSNVSTVTGATVTNALDNLNTGKENTSNKQNSLITDGTGVKFPTVDAVSGGTAYKRTIAQIRALSGTLPNTNFYTTDLGQEGNWYYDSSDVTSADNTGTILVTSDGKRIKRVFSSSASVKWFGAKGDGVADDKTAIQNAVNSYSDILIPSGTYLISGSINLNNKNNITGAGIKTIISSNGDFSVFVLTSHDISIRNLSIAGLGRGTATNYTTTRPNNNGIYIDGTIVKKTSIVLENLTLYSLGNAGIYIKNNLSTTFAPNIIASNLNTAECLVGYWFDERAEYSTFSNCVVNACEYGIRMRGGNNSYIGGMLTNNRTGVLLEGGLNDCHSVFSATAINHSIEYSVQSNGVTSGHLFDGCMLYYGDIYLKDSNMIKFASCDFYTPNLYADNSTKCEFMSNKWTSTPVLSLAFLGNPSDVRFFDNSITSGGGNLAVTNSELKGSLKLTETGNPILTLKSTSTASTNNRNWAILSNLSNWGEFDILKSSVAGVDPDTSVLNINAATGALKITSLSGGATYTLVADIDGKVSKTATPPARPYLVYTALISQSGTSAPTATVLENTTGQTFTWSYLTVGQYKATYSSTLDSNKTAVTFINGAYTGNFSPSIFVNSGDVTVHAKNGATATDGILSKNFLEIRIYP